MGINSHIYFSYFQLQVTGLSWNSTGSVIAASYPFRHGLIGLESNALLLFMTFVHKIMTSDLNIVLFLDN